tara:strand:- start:4900 stop:5142 length:243 start_codon:yes stop_codon:yes gene_type:complete
MSEADEKPMIPIVLSGALGALALADAFVITQDSDDIVKILVGIGALAVSAILLSAGGLSMPAMPSRKKEEQEEPEPEPKF